MYREGICVVNILYRIHRGLCIHRALRVLLGHSGIYELIADGLCTYMNYVQGSHGIVGTRKKSVIEIRKSLLICCKGIKLCFSNFK